MICQVKYHCNDFCNQLMYPSLAAKFFVYFRIFFLFTGKPSFFQALIPPSSE